MPTSLSMRQIDLYVWYSFEATGAMLRRLRASTIVFALIAFVFWFAMSALASTTDQDSMSAICDELRQDNFSVVYDVYGVSLRFK